MAQKFVEPLWPMSPSRAREVIAQSKARTVYGPWSDQISKVLRPGEREQVVSVWKTMPGHTCFLDALRRIART